MSEFDDLKKTLSLINQSLTEVRKEIEDLKAKSVSREDLEKLEDRLAWLEGPLEEETGPLVDAGPPEKIPKTEAPQDVDEKVLEEGPDVPLLQETKSAPEAAPEGRGVPLIPEEQDEETEEALPSQASESEDGPPPQAEETPPERPAPAVGELEEEAPPCEETEKSTEEEGLAGDFEDDEAVGHPVEDTPVQEEEVQESPAPQSERPQITEEKPPQHEDHTAPEVPEETEKKAPGQVPEEKRPQTPPAPSKLEESSPFVAVSKNGPPAASMSSAAVSTKPAASPPGGSGRRPQAPPPSRPPMKWDWASIESKIMPWITRAGVAIVVVGLFYLLSLGFQRLGPWGKTAMVYGACAVLWITGFVSERFERYSTWGKMLLAGGWAGIYITTFAIHHLPAAQLIKDPFLAVLLLMGIATGMIIHSFKYKTESLTTLAYFIAFLTISLSNVAFFSLVAISVLAVSMLFIHWRMRWYWLPFLGVLATYGSHAIWIGPLAEFFEGQGVHGPEFLPGVIMLVVYWLVFTTSIYIVREENKKHEAMSMRMLVANTFLFVIVFRYHVGAEHPELRWYFTAALALAHIGLAFLSRFQKREKLFVMSFVIAIASTTMTLYYLLPGEWLSIAWLLQAEALYIAGVLADEKWFRRTAVVNFVLVGVWLFVKDYGGPVFTGPLEYVTLPWSGWMLESWVLSFLPAIAVSYINSVLRHALRHREQRQKGAWIFAYAGSALALFVMANIWFPHLLLSAAVACSLLALALMETGIKYGDGHIRLQGIFFSALGIICGMAPLIEASQMYYDHSLLYRVGCEAVVIVFAYIVFARFQKVSEKGEKPQAAQAAATIFSAIAAFIAVMLLLREFHPPRSVLWLGLAWLMLGIILLETGIALRNTFFRLQGYIVTMLCLVASMIVFLVRTEWFYDSLLGLVAFGGVVVGFFYVFARLVKGSRHEDPRLSNIEKSEAWKGSGPFAAGIFAVAGTLIMLLLLRNELGDPAPMYMAVSFLIVSIALVETGIATRLQILRLLGMAVAIIAFFVGLYFNLEPGPRSYFLFSERFVTLLLSAGGLFYLFARLKYLELPSPVDDSKTEKSSPEASASLVLSVIYSVSATVLLIILIRQELVRAHPMFIAVGFMVLSVALLEIGLAIKSPALRIQGFLVAALVFGFAMYYNLAEGRQFWHISERLLTLAICTAGTFYMFARLKYLSDAESPRLSLTERKQTVPGSGWSLSAIFSIAGTFLLLLLLWQELVGTRPLFIAVAYLIAAAALFEAGAAIRNQPLRTEAYFAAFIAFMSALFYNHRPGAPLWFLSERLVTLAICGGTLFYLFARIKVLATKEASPLFGFETEELWKGSGPVVGAFLSFLATVLVIVLIHTELVEYAPLFIAVCSMAFAVVLLESGIGWRGPPLRVLGAGVALLAFYWALAYNVIQAADFETMPRLLSLALVTVGFYYFYERLYRGRLHDKEWIDSAYAVPFFSYPGLILLVLLIGREVWGPAADWVAVAWLAPLFAIIAMTLVRRDIHFLLQTLALSALIFFWSLGVSIPSRLVELSADYRTWAVLPVIIVFYGVFAAVYIKRPKPAESEKARYINWGRDVYSWAASILLVALVTVEVNQVSEALTTAVWIVMVPALFETGSALKNRSFRMQAHLLMIASCLRAGYYNIPDSLGPVLFLDGRTASLLLLAVSLIYLYLRLYRSEDKSLIELPERIWGVVYSYLGVLSLLVLAVVEAPDRAWIPTAWSLIALLVMVFGMIVRDRHPLIQSFALIFPIVVTCLAYGFIAAEGDVMDISLRKITAGGTIFFMFISKIAWHVALGRADIPVLTNLKEKTLSASRHAFSIPAALMLTVLIYLDWSQNYLTLAWALEGLLLMVMGFALRDRLLRFGGLGILAICIVKVFYDLLVNESIEKIFKVVATIVLGVVLIAIGFIYARFSEQIKRLMRE